MKKVFKRAGVVLQFIVTFFGLIFMSMTNSKIGSEVDTKGGNTTDGGSCCVRCIPDWTGYDCDLTCTWFHMYHRCTHWTLD